MKEYSRYLRYTGFPELAKRVWRYRRIFLKHPKRYTEKNKKIMNEIILSCKEDLLKNHKMRPMRKRTSYILNAGTRKIAILKRSSGYL